MEENNRTAGSGSGTFQADPRKLSPAETGKKEGGRILPEILAGILVFLTVVCVCVVFTLNCRALYRYDCDHLDIPAQSGFSRELCLENYDIMIDYNNIGGPDTLEFIEFPMSDTARIHFEQVRQIFLAIEWFAIFGGAASILFAVWFLRRGRTRWMRTAGWLGLAVPLTLGLLISANWDDVFITFHQLVFNNDYWLFDPATDPVILILPDTFFMHCAVMIVALILAVSAVLLILHRILFRRTRPGTAESGRNA